MNFTELTNLMYESLVYIAVAFVIFFLGKVFYQLTHKSISVKKELVEKDNLAFSVAHVGYFIGLLMAIGGSIIGPSNGLVQDIIDILVYGVLSILLLNISLFLGDKIILRKFSVQKEIISDQNVGTGAVEAGIAIASGLMIFGAVIGEVDGTLLQGVISSIVFWAAGQVALLLTSYIYQLITPYDIHEHIEKDNIAVGVGMAGAIIAIGNIIRFGLAGDLDGWGETFMYTGFEIALGLLILPVMRFLTDRILLPGQRLTDEIINQEKPNVGAAIIEAFAYIGGSVLITWCL